MQTYATIGKTLYPFGQTWKLWSPSLASNPLHLNRLTPHLHSSALAIVLLPFKWVACPKVVACCGFTSMAMPLAWNLIVFDRGYQKPRVDSKSFQSRSRDN